MVQILQKISQLFFQAGWFGYTLCWNYDPDLQAGKANEQRDQFIASDAINSYNG